MSFDGGGGTTLMNDVLLIIGVPTTEAAPTLTPDEWAAGLTSVTVGAGVLHGTWSSATPDNDVYEFLDLPNTGGGNSQNYANWSTPGVWHDPMGETAWDIYTFALTFTPLMNDTDRNYVEFVSSIPVGSYLAGFACHQNGTPCGNPGKTEGTPFTGAGFVTPTPGTPTPFGVPEPSSLILLGLSFGALGLGRRSNSKSTA
jgi:PEP-CTERM motif